MNVPVCFRAKEAAGEFCSAHYSGGHLYCSGTHGNGILFFSVLIKAGYIAVTVKGHQRRKLSDKSKRSSESKLEVCTGYNYRQE